MASLTGSDGILGQLMNFAPPALGQVLPGGAAPDTGSLAETAAFGADPGNLRMLSFVPEELPAGAPLVVVLHGCGQTAAEYDAGAGWSTLADRFGFALLLPEQRRGNNAQGCFDWFQPEDVARGQGEVASIAGMVATMLEAHGLDRHRVFVTGLSAGGAMAAALLATHPEVFAGGAIIAGLPFGSAGSVTEAFGVMGQGRMRPAQELGDRVRAASAHSGPWPAVSIWQGTADTTVNPVNAEELRKQWADVHGVTNATAVETVLDGAKRRVWRGADGRAVLETVTVPGLGHATPIDPKAADEAARCGSAGASRFILPAGISSSYRIAESWRLVSHRRPNRKPAAEPGSARPRMPAWQDLLPGQRPAMPEIGGQIADARALIGKVLRGAGLTGDRRKS